MRWKPFRMMWAAQFVSVFGDVLALFGVISTITFRLHGTAFQVTAVTVAYVMPMVMLAPIAGVFVDRWRVKPVMVASDLIRAALVLLLAAAADARQICVILAALSIVSSFFAPAESVALATLVPKEGLLAARALLAQNFYAVKLLAPVLAGALVAWLTERYCFYLDAVSFLFSAAILSSLRMARQESTGEKTLPAVATDFLEGTKFVFTHRRLAFVFVAVAISMFVAGSFNPLISIYIRDSLSAGSFTLGVLNSIAGVGLILGAQFVNRMARHMSSARVVLAGLLGLGLGTAVLAVFHNLAMAGASALTIGFALATVLVPAETLPQQEAPREMIGRVSSNFISLSSLAQVLGLLLAGYLVHRIGMRGLFATGAALLTILAVVAFPITRDPCIPRRQAVAVAKPEGR